MRGRRDRFMPVVSTKVRKGRQSLKQLRRDKALEATTGAIRQMVAEICQAVARKRGSDADAFYEPLEPVRERLRTMPAEEVFYVLFSIAVKLEADGANVGAASLLVELDPPCHVTCEDALRLLAKGWWVGDTLVPFYLVTHFGRQQLHRSAKKVARHLRGSRKHRVEWVICELLNATSVSLVSRYMTFIGLHPVSRSPHPPGRYI
jgi:hypothetical protein